MGRGAQAPLVGKQLADFTGHIIFYGHPKMSGTRRAFFPPPLSFSLSFFLFDSDHCSHHCGIFLAGLAPEMLGSPLGSAELWVQRGKSVISS